MSNGGGTWFGRGFVPTKYQPPPDVGGPQDTYNRGRWFVRQGEEKKILFLEDLADGFQIVEHPTWDTKKDQPWFFPCPQYFAEKKRCWLHEQGAPVIRMLFLSVIDRYGYVPKRGPNAGKHITNVKRIFPIPERLLPLFIRRDRHCKGLKFQECDVTRVDRFAKLGDDWTPVRKYTMEELAKEKIDVKSFDWEKIIPLSITAEQQEQFFRDNPSVTWKTMKERGEDNEGVEEPPGHIEEPEGEEEPPF